MADCNHAIQSQISNFKFQISNLRPLFYSPTPRPPELAEFGEAVGAPAMGISAVSGRGVEQVANKLWDMLEAAGERESDDHDE